MQKCDVNCYDKCERNVYLDKKCILHSKKADYQSDKRDKTLETFYDEFIIYIINEVFDDFIKDDKNLSLKSIVLNNDKYLEEKEKARVLLHDYIKESKFNNKKYNETLKKITFIPKCIHFPERNSRDSFDYLKLLNLFGKIHFNYCEFYISNLNLENVECFFQDCHFHNSWTLYDYALLDNEDKTIYQTCVFNGYVSNYTPEERTKLANYNHIQFDYTCQFNNDIKFYRTRFQQMLFNTNQNNYLDENFINTLHFESCIFDKKFILNGYAITNCTFIDSNLIEKFEFKENTIDNFYINNTNFNSLADLYGSTFRIFKISKSIFNNFVGFENCNFGSINNLKNEIATFKYATFIDFINFRNTTFSSGLDIQNINLKEAPNFLSMNVNFKNTNRETLRIVKDSFDKNGNIIEGNKFYQMEMQKREEELSDKKNSDRDIIEWLVFKIHGISSNHSQNWVLSLLWIINLTFIYSQYKILLTQDLTEYLIIPFILNTLLIFISLINISGHMRKKYHILISIPIYFVYSFITKDYYLYCFSNNINPFSIMTGEQTLTFSLLVYKMLIAYLIYQFIISIRQDTRRK